MGAVFGVVLLVVVVALASRPASAGPAGGGGDAAARLVLDVLAYLLVLLTALTLLALVWAFWPRPDEEWSPLPRRRRRLSLFAMAAMAAVLLAWWRSGRLARLPGLRPGGQGAPLSPPAVAPARPVGPPAGFDWPAAAIVAVLLVAAAALTWWTLRRRRGPGAPRSLLAHLEALLDDAVDDVLREADPRRAVIAAWARLERVLAGHGLARREAEAPLEYAVRAGAELAVEAVSLERLADLYEWARFSLNEVTPAMREEALGGLLAVRDGLRNAA